MGHMKHPFSMWYKTLDFFNVSQRFNVWFSLTYHLVFTHIKFCVS
jgi:hypothetical protein